MGEEKYSLRIKEIEEKYKSVLFIYSDPIVRVAVGAGMKKANLSF